jgi:hypothetical protein
VPALRGAGCPPQVFFLPKQRRIPSPQLERTAGRRGAKGQAAGWRAPLVVEGRAQAPVLLVQRQQQLPEAERQRVLLFLVFLLFFIRVCRREAPPEVSG